MLFIRVNQGELTINDFRFCRLRSSFLLWTPTLVIMLLWFRVITFGHMGSRHNILSLDGEYKVSYLPSPNMLLTEGGVMHESYWLACNHVMYINKHVKRNDALRYVQDIQREEIGG